MIVQIEDLIRKYNYEDKVMSAITIGVIDEDSHLDSEYGGDEVQLKSVFSYNLESREELEVMKSIMTSQYRGEDNDLDSMLGDLGISLN